MFSIMKIDQTYRPFLTDVATGILFGIHDELARNGLSEEMVKKTVKKVPNRYSVDRWEEEYIGFRRKP